MSEILTQQALKKQKYWSRWYVIWISMHYVVGVAGVLAGVLAAGALGTLIGQNHYVQEVGGLIAAASSAVLGFLKPDNRAQTFGRAERIVTMAHIQYLTDNDSNKFATEINRAIAASGSDQDRNANA